MDIRVYQSKPSTAWLLVAGSLLLGVLWLKFPGRPGAEAAWHVLGALAVMIGGGVYFTLEALRPRRLRVTDEALLFEKGDKLLQTLPWRDIEAFVEVRRRSISMLGYRLRKGAPKTVGARVNRFFEGADGILYGFWPRPAKEMAAQLSIYLESLRDTETGPAVVTAAAGPARAKDVLDTATVSSDQGATVSEPRRLFARKRDAPPGGRPIVW